MEAIACRREVCANGLQTSKPCDVDQYIWTSLAFGVALTLGNCGPADEILADVPEDEQAIEAIEGKDDGVVKVSVTPSKTSYS